MVTILTISPFCAFLGAGRFVNDCPITKLVTGCIHIGINIAVTTMASVGRITLVHAGRCSYDCFIIVTCCYNLAGFEVVAISTISAFLTLLGAGRFVNDCPIAEAVSLGGTGIADGVRFVAALAFGGLGSVNGAGCIVVGSVIREVVAQSIHIGVHMAVTAARTGMCGVTLFRTGRGSNHRFIIVATGCNDLSFIVVTVFTITSLLTVSGTGYRLDDTPRTIAVTQ